MAAEELLDVALIPATGTAVWFEAALAEPVTTELSTVVDDALIPPIGAAVSLEDATPVAVISLAMAVAVEAFPVEDVDAPFPVALIEELEAEALPVLEADADAAVVEAETAVELAAALEVAAASPATGGATPESLTVKYEQSSRKPCWAIGTMAG